MLGPFSVPQKGRSPAKGPGASGPRSRDAQRGRGSDPRIRGSEGGACAPRVWGPGSPDGSLNRGKPVRQDLQLQKGQNLLWGGTPSRAETAKSCSACLLLPPSHPCHSLPLVEPSPQPAALGTWEPQPGGASSPAAKRRAWEGRGMGGIYLCLKIIGCLSEIPI